MECITIRSTDSSGGRDPKFGEGKRRAGEYQPCSQGGHSPLVLLLLIRFLGVRLGIDVEPSDAVAYLPQI